MSKNKPVILNFEDIEADFLHSQLLDMIDEDRVIKFYDFGKGLEPAHRHPNGHGIIANTATVEKSVYVAIDCLVSGNSILRGNVSILNSSWIEDSVTIIGEGKGVILDDVSSLTENVSVSGSYTFKGAHIAGKHKFKNTGVRSIKHFKLFRL